MTDRYSHDAQLEQADGVTETIQTKDSALAVSGPSLLRVALIVIAAVTAAAKLYTTRDIAAFKAFLQTNEGIEVLAWIAGVAALIWGQARGILERRKLVKSARPNVRVVVSNGPPPPVT